MTDYALRISDAELARYRTMAAAAQSLETELWNAAGIVPGARVLDLGCGPGAMVLALAEIVGPTGSVVGVDADAGAMAMAQALIEAAGLTNARAQAGDATATGLPPGEADVAMMRHVLAHNQRIEQDLVRHAAELVRPGGHVFLVDVDVSMLRQRDVEPELLDLHDRYIAFHAQRGNDLATGLRLVPLLTGAGLEVVVDTALMNVVDVPPGLRSPGWAARDALVETGLADAADLHRWDEAYTRSDAAVVRPKFFGPYFVAVGRRP